MSHIDTILTVSLTLYALVMTVFLISENRRPQATLAWILVFVFAPVIGGLIYILFGRDRKAFSKQRRLLRQDLEANALPLLSPLLSRQDAEIARLEHESAGHRRLMMLVRRNSHSALTKHNCVEIQQDAAEFYPSMMKDIKSARHSIHLQYFIWGADPFTDGLKEILTAKARAGVEVRLLYDPIGSQAHVGRAYVREMLAAGIRMAPTSPLYQLHTISYRNHRKITVIDGAIGYTGGMNIGQEQISGGEGFDSWRDTQLRIVGMRRAVAIGVHGRLVQRRQGKPLRCCIFPDKRDGAGGWRRAGPDPDIGTRLAMGGNQATLLLHDRIGETACFHPVALLHPRRNYRRSADVRSPVGCRRQGHAERPTLRQQTPRLGGEHLCR
jgi:phospholipase D-like protein